MIGGKVIAGFFGQSQSVATQNQAMAKFLSTLNGNPLHFYFLMRTLTFTVWESISTRWFASFALVSAPLQKAYSGTVHLRNRQVTQNRPHDNRSLRKTTREDQWMTQWILKWDHLIESYWAAFPCELIIAPFNVHRSNFLACGQNHLLPCKWKFPVMLFCDVLPLKLEVLRGTFLWCYFLSLLMNSYCVTIFKNKSYWAVLSCGSVC